MFLLVYFSGNSKSHCPWPLILPFEIPFLCISITKSGGGRNFAQRLPVGDHLETVFKGGLHRINPDLCPSIMIFVICQMTAWPLLRLKIWLALPLAVVEICIFPRPLLGSLCSSGDTGNKIIPPVKFKDRHLAEQHKLISWHFLQRDVVRLHRRWLPCHPFGCFECIPGNYLS